MNKKAKILTGIAIACIIGIIIAMIVTKYDGPMTFERCPEEGPKEIEWWN